MSPLVVGIAVLVSAAALALWVDTRLRGRSPATILKLLLHGVMASLVVRLGAAIGPQLFDRGSRVLLIVALCLVVLPGWLYAFLVSFWAMRLVRSLLPR